MKIPGKARVNAESGFSMPEVLISSTLLAFVVASSTQLYVNSGQTIQRGSARDAVYARIADDLEELRRETWRFACEDGTACTGNPDHADMPVRYKTARRCTEAPCEPGELVRIQALTSACSTHTTAAYMAANHKDLNNVLVFPLVASASGTPTIVSWTANLPTDSEAPPQAKGIRIERRIMLNNTDGNQLDVNYSTSEESSISIQLNAALTPQALSWCP